MPTYNNSTWKGHHFKWIIKRIFLLSKILSLCPFLTKMWMIAGRHIRFALFLERMHILSTVTGKNLIKDDEFKMKPKFIFCTRNQIPHDVVSIHVPFLRQFLSRWKEIFNTFVLRGMFTKLLLFITGSKDLVKKAENGYIQGTIVRRILSSRTSFIEHINYFSLFFLSIVNLKQWPSLRRNLIPGIRKLQMSVKGITWDWWHYGRKLFHRNPNLQSDRHVITQSLCKWCAEAPWAVAEQTELSWIFKIKNITRVSTPTWLVLGLKQDDLSLWYCCLDLWNNSRKLKSIMIL